MEKPPLPARDVGRSHISSVRWVLTAHWYICICPIWMQTNDVQPWPVGQVPSWEPTRCAIAASRASPPAVLSQQCVLIIWAVAWHLVVPVPWEPWATVPSQEGLNLSWSSVSGLILFFFFSVVPSPEGGYDRFFLVCVQYAHTHIHTRLDLSGLFFWEMLSV